MSVHTDLRLSSRIKYPQLAIYLLSVLLEGVTLLIMHSLSCGADNSLSEHWYIYAAPPVIIAAEQEDPLT